jgi:signal transduction histidine kinase
MGELMRVLQRAGVAPAGSEPALGPDFIQYSRMEQALREADRRKDEFLALIAHEQRNPTLDTLLRHAQSRITKATSKVHRLPGLIALPQLTPADDVGRQEVIA